jgi:hypothetical protein
MQSFFAVATVARCILLCTAPVEGASTAGVEANHPHTDATTALSFQELNAHVASPNLARVSGDNSPPISEAELLAARLEAVGVHDVDGMGAALEGLGLRTPADLELLDDWAVAELDKELRESDASLGDRAKLRIRGIRGTFSAAPGPVSAQAQVLQQHEASHGGGAGAGSLQPRRAQTTEGTSEADAKGGGEFSMDTLALVSTAVLGIATFVLQDRVAKNAEAAVKELEHARVEHDRGRELATVQLERVRSQMGDVYRPVNVMLNHADYCSIYMQHELGFECKDAWGHEFVRPFTLWPHVEVLTRDLSPKYLTAFKGSPYKKYSPADIALLEDPTKRQLYIEAHNSCIAPRYRGVATILSTKSALIENPPASYLDGMFPHGVADWTKFSQGTLSVHMMDLGAFAHAWAPLERRWEAGGAPATKRTRSSAVCNSQIVAYAWMRAGLTVCRLDLQTSPACSPTNRIRFSSYTLSS